MNSSAPVMTVREVADYLRLHRSTVYRLAQSGVIPAFKIGGDWRFNRESIDQWRLQQEQGTPEAAKHVTERPPLTGEKGKPVLLDLHGNRKLFLDPASLEVKLLHDAISDSRLSELGAAVHDE